LMLPSWCAGYDKSNEAIPTGLKCSRQVHSEPACVPVMEGAKPVGVARELERAYCFPALSYRLRIAGGKARPGVTFRWEERREGPMSLQTVLMN
jgi:hypothetical protein